MVVKYPPAHAGDIGDLGSIPGLQEEMAIRSNILARKFPWAEEPGGLLSPLGLKKPDVTEDTNVITHFPYR